jgi:hypothetical protein
MRINRRSFVAMLGAGPLVGAVGVSTCEDLIPRGEWEMRRPPFPTLETPADALFDERWRVIWWDEGGPRGEIAVPCHRTGLDTRMPRYTRLFTHGGTGCAPAPFWGLEARDHEGEAWARLFQKAGAVPMVVELARFLPGRIEVAELL